MTNQISVKCPMYNPYDKDGGICIQEHCVEGCPVICDNGIIQATPTKPMVEVEKVMQASFIEIEMLPQRNDFFNKDDYEMYKSGYVNGQRRMRDSIRRNSLRQLLEEK